MNKKKIMSLIMALVMLVGVFSPLSALAVGEENAQASDPKEIKVNVHKVLISEDALSKHNAQKKYDPTKAMTQEELKTFFGDKDVKTIDNVYFIAIKENETGYNDFDSKTKEEQKNIIESLDAGRKGKTENGGIKTFKLASPGNYKIYEVKFMSEYKGPKGEVLTGVKAIPVDLKLPEHARNQNGIQNEIHVYPKNSEKKVQFDKNFAKENGLEAITDPNTLKDVGAVFDNYKKEKANAKAEVGKTIHYETKAFLPKDSVYTNLDLKDSMDKGLLYDSVTGVKATVDPTSVTLDAKDYTVTNQANGFSLTFTESGLKKINDAAKTQDVTVTFTYDAKVTADAVVDNPMDNHASFIYNHKPSNPTSEKVKPKNNEITVTKTWGSDGKGTAPSEVWVKYQLLDENDNPVADVTFKDKDNVDRTNLGNGITFEKTGEFSGKFKGLKADKEYKIKEIVNGYEPEFTVNNTDGTVTIKNKVVPNIITPTPPKVTVGGKRFVKTNQDGSKRLAGAEFKIKNLNNGTDNGKFLKITGTDNNNAYITAEKAYNDAIQAVNDALKKGEISATNKVTIDSQDYDNKEAAMNKVKELEDARNKAFVGANLKYEWVEESKATTFNTNADGQFEVKGLAYGKYQAVETKAPAGFALPTNGGTFEFTVMEGSYDGKPTGVEADHIGYADNQDTIQGQKIVNNDVTIPQTGGMGTVLFTVVGISLMAGAVVAMKRNREEA